MHGTWRGWIAIAWLAALPAVAAQQLPSFEQVRSAHVSSEARIVDRYGEPLSEIRMDPSGRRLEWVTLRALSPAMLEALLAAEDRRFYQHGGVDWRAAAAALWQNLWYDHARGASTLSMQLAGLLDPALRATAAHGWRRTLGQKWDQALAAKALEEDWSKEQILEAYLNLAPFRGELSGVPAAAWGLFRKTPATLDRAEAAVLAVLLRGPNAASGVVAKRACVLARKLGEAEACHSAEELAARLGRARFEPRWNLAPELARTLLHRPGEVLATTLDRDAQALVRAALGDQDGVAAVVVDNASAGVLAQVGTPQAVGSAAAASALLRPMTYGLGLERRLITAATLLPMGEQVPGWVSVRTAASTGLGAPAESLAGRLEPPGLAERLLGMDSSVDVHSPGDLRVLAGLYRALAMGGLWLAPLTTPGDPRAGRRLLRPEAAFVVAEMLAEPGASRAVMVAAGEGVALGLGFDAGVTVAARVPGDVEAARMVVGKLLATVPHAVGWPRPPPGVVQQWVAFDPAVERPRREWFLQGTEVALSTPPPLPVRIVWPANESLVDVRAEMADPAFALVFEARPGAGDLVWHVNGRQVGRGAKVRWRPDGGLVYLELADGAGQVLDRVTFAVRTP